MTKKFFDNGKIRLFQKDNRITYQIAERENDFMHISNLREMETYENLGNYCTKINKWFMPVNVLPHVVKHFPGDSNPKKLALIEDILDFKNRGYSYIIYTTTDERYQMHKAKVKMKLHFIQVMRENELYEICITDSVKVGKKDYCEVNQINSYYRVDIFHMERLEKLQYSQISDSYFATEGDKYHMFQLTQDERIQTKKPLEVFEKENNQLAVELLKATKNMSADLSLNWNREITEGVSETREESPIAIQKETISNFPVSTTEKKLSLQEIREFFKGRDREITLEELLYLYEKNMLPLLKNREYAAKKIMESPIIKRFSPLYLLLNSIFNGESNFVECRNFTATESECALLMDEISSQILSLNKEFGEKLFSIEKSKIIFNIQL